MKTIYFGPILLCLSLSVACQEKARHSDPERAIQACLKGIASLGRGQLRPESMSLVLGNACKDLYVEKSCRQAFGSQGALPPDKRAAAIAEVCKKAYCPNLKEPKPQICDQAALPLSPLRLLPLWHELQWAILARDLGPQRAAGLYGRLVFAQLLMQPIIATPLKIELPKAIPLTQSPPSSIVGITQKDKKVILSVDGKEIGGWSVPAKPSQKDLEALLAVLKKHEKPPQIIIQADRNVLYKNIVGLMDALKSAGFEQFTFAVSEKDTK
jgi:biopolymer transport protein ExbD